MDEDISAIAPKNTQTNLSFEGMKLIKLGKIIGYCVGGGVAVLTLSVGAAAQAVTVIDTTPPDTQIFSFGEPDTATYGQTITVPTIDNVLTEFTFLVDDFDSDPDVIDFAAYVMAWDSVNFRATGPVLYNSGLRSTTRAVGNETFTFNTGGLTLVPNTQYVLFLSASDFFDGSPGLGTMGGRSTDAYAGGDFFFLNNGNDFSAVSTATWESFLFSPDTAFRASFTSGSQPEPVPEPTSTLGILAIGALGGSLVLKRKRQQTA